MNPDDSPIKRTALSYLEAALLTMDPDAEPTPFVIVGGPQTMAHVGLHSLDDGDFDDTAGTVLPALIVLNAADEVALVTFLDDPEICGDEVECAAVANWGPQGRSLSVAPVTRRHEQPPIIGGWRDSGASTMALDSVDNGVRHGTALLERLSDPDADDLREQIDLIRITAATEDTDVLPLTVDALRRWGWLD